ncbi:bis(5'-nucleosyl)-tetraphosphatase (symmetrical) ApaH [Vibrio harveyi]|uniref:Bis(5'-nucleosyl)-tetraphosphatase, symmetrical n=1 Tax=Vibrio harveyi TaxID=669 RepID=A0A8B3DAX6_VIBHA|nr:bis(5'-nucleosyl)-tetraphosphatase (symmetrical) ApaH [Vibrio harveyi]MBY6236344.1 bis(5'-nucleosyl)-tetraphosphatase (symmetrical) ApaH [Vibrio harveyi]RIW06807.1 bis(5'-nucleosyl)-tetraphosphatase (symmetrical) [Vibrio harveyi]HDM8127371.1 bis(5'-nucleosyl)-tetraphosphatase (symmetrical) ApaH [Vibrio harveyi]
MANYIVGDIQGCFDELQQLLEQVNFSVEHDQLWLAGDLVARGPKSLETLRFVRSLGDSAKVVLGNHDLHLMAVSQGLKKVKDKDKTAPIFSAPDKDELLTWLAQQPLLAEHDEFVMCHAGISPLWDLETARACAREVEAIIRSEQLPWLLENMYSNQPDLWDESLSGLDRYRYTINAFTRMRFCFPDGRLDMDCKLPPQEVSEDELMPWFKLPQRIPLEKAVLFGHWAALQGHIDENIIGLDTGCVWGGSLTMIRWEDKQVFIQEALS